MSKEEHQYIIYPRFYSKVQMVFSYYWDAYPEH